MHVHCVTQYNRTHYIMERLLYTSKVDQWKGWSYFAHQNLNFSKKEPFLFLAYMLCWTSEYTFTFLHFLQSMASYANALHMYLYLNRFCVNKANDWKSMNISIFTLTASAFNPHLYLSTFTCTFWNLWLMLRSVLFIFKF